MISLISATTNKTCTSAQSMILQGSLTYVYFSPKPIFPLATMMNRKHTRTHARNKSMRYEPEVKNFRTVRPPDGIHLIARLNRRSLVLVQYLSLQEVLIVPCTSVVSYWFDCSHEGQWMNLCYGLCVPFAHRGLAENRRGSLSALYFRICTNWLWSLLSSSCVKLWKNTEPLLQRLACRSKFFSWTQNEEKGTKIWHPCFGHKILTCMICCLLLIPVAPPWQLLSTHSHVPAHTHTHTDTQR